MIVHFKKLLSLFNINMHYLVVHFYEQSTKNSLITI